MATKRRNCRLTDRDNRNTTDLTQYSDIIIETINRVVPGKNPTVEQDYFATDPLTHSEAVRLGRELIRNDKLRELARIVTQYRLFEGREVDNTANSAVMPLKNRTIAQRQQKRKGGRMS